MCSYLLAHHSSLSPGLILNELPDYCSDPRLDQCRADSDSRFLMPWSFCHHIPRDQLPLPTRPSGACLEVVHLYPPGCPLRCPARVSEPTEPGSIRVSWSNSSGPFEGALEIAFLRQARRHDGRVRPPRPRSSRSFGSHHLRSLLDRSWVGPCRVLCATDPWK